MSASATPQQRKSRGLVVGAIILGLGAALIVTGYLFTWGFCAYSPGGFLVVFGVLAIIGALQISTGGPEKEQDSAEPDLAEPVQAPALSGRTFEQCFDDRKSSYERLMRWTEQRAYHKHAVAFWRQRGLGEHLHGLLMVGDPAWLAPVLDDWLGGPNTHRVALAYTALGDILFLQGLDDRAVEEGASDLTHSLSDIALLRPRYGSVHMVARSAQELLFHLETPAWLDECLGRALFMDAGAALEADQIFGFVPALILGGSESADCLQPMGALVHWDLLLQLQEPLSLHGPRADEAPQLKRCLVHDQELVTVDGFEAHMHFLPSNKWMDAAADNPCCLDIGMSLVKPKNMGSSATSLTYCEACERGMANR